MMGKRLCAVLCLMAALVCLSAVGIDIGQSDARINNTPTPHPPSPSEVTIGPSNPIDSIPWIEGDGTTSTEEPSSKNAKDSPETSADVKGDSEAKAGPEKADGSTTASGQDNTSDASKDRILYPEANGDDDGDDDDLLQILLGFLLFMLVIAAVVALIVFVLSFLSKVSPRLRAALRKKGIDFEKNK